MCGATSLRKYSSSWTIPAMSSRRPHRRAAPIAPAVPLAGGIRPATRGSPGDFEPTATPAGDLDRGGGPLVGVDPPEEQQMLAGIRMDREPVDIDSVMNG